MQATSRKRGFLFWLALGATAMAAAMAALLSIELGRKDEARRDAKILAETSSAPASEAEREFLRLRQALDSTVNSRTPPDDDELTLRYDIFLSRLKLLRDSPSLSFVRESNEYVDLLPKLDKLVLQAEVVMAANPRSHRALATLLADVTALSLEMNRLSRAADSGVNQLVERQKFALERQSNVIIALALLQLVLLVVATTALMIRHKRQEQERTALNSLTQELLEANRVAQAAMETLENSQDALARSETKAAVSTLMASVAHELGTPLGNTLMTASTLVDHSHVFKKSLDENRLKRSELSDYVGRVHEGNELMMRNLRRGIDLLKNFKQVATDQASEHRRVFDLATVVEEVLGTLAPSLKRYPHAVDQDIEKGITLDSFPGPLGQVIINLVNNAYLHAFDNREACVLRISATSSGDSVVIRFADNGVGMSEETLRRLFEPFFSTKQGKGGTGLGMTIVASLVQKTLGGTIKVESTMGAGTTFSVALPRIAPSAAA
jgi:signal transduction histidine kinase